MTALRTEPLSWPRREARHLTHSLMGGPNLIEELGYPDSNQKRQDQNLQCYHYTIPQSIDGSSCVGVSRRGREARP